MKDLKEQDIVQGIERDSRVQFTTDESLNRFKAPEFESPKLKKVKEEFAKTVIIKR